jgi:hypothetical protein
MSKMIKKKGSKSLQDSDGTVFQESMRCLLVEGKNISNKYLQQVSRVLEFLSWEKS